MLKCSIKMTTFKPVRVENKHTTIYRRQWIRKITAQIWRRPTTCRLSASSKMVRGPFFVAVALRETHLGKCNGNGGGDGDGDDMILYYYKTGVLFSPTIASNRGNGGCGY